MDRVKCSVKDGRFVEPCDTLRDQTDTPMAMLSRAKGTVRWHYTNIQTGEPSRTFFGVKTKANPEGFAFNFCPFCGERIDAPFADSGEETDNAHD